MKCRADHRAEDGVGTPRVAVSVVVPTRNRAAQAEACLGALARQSMDHGSFEVVVVDDGSDSPLAFDEGRWSTAFPLTVIRQENSGPAGARNRGVMACRGDIVAFTDDDCRPEPRWLETLVAAVRANADALVGGSTVNGLPESLFAESSQLIIDLVYEHANAIRGSARFFASNNMACRKEAFLAIGGFDPAMRPASEDREFCDRWLGRGATLDWAREATIVHRHTQGLLEFTRLHFRYGRGAHLYKSIRSARRSGTMHDAVRFHAALPALLWRRRKRYPPLRFAAICLALAWWEVVNAAGFAWQWFLGPLHAPLRT